MNKRMRRSQAITAILMIALCVALASIAGCSSSGAKSDKAEAEAETSVFSAPALQPVDHEGRFEQGGATLCYTCHGATDKGNPQQSTARAIPNDHYQGGSPDSQELNADRNQCITCHPAYGS